MKHYAMEPVLSQKLYAQYPQLIHSKDCFANIARLDALLANNGDTNLFKYTRPAYDKLAINLEKGHKYLIG